MRPAAKTFSSPRIGQILTVVEMEIWASHPSSSIVTSKMCSVDTCSRRNHCIGSSKALPKSRMSIALCSSVLLTTYTVHTQNSLQCGSRPRKPCRSKGQRRQHSKNNTVGPSSQNWNLILEKLHQVFYFELCKILLYFRLLDTQREKNVFFMSSVEKRKI